MLTIINNCNNMTKVTEEYQVIKDIDSFLESIAFLEVEPQEIVYDELQPYQLNLLLENGFTLIELSKELSKKNTNTINDNISKSTAFINSPTVDTHSINMDTPALPKNISKLKPSIDKSNTSSKKSSAIKKSRGLMSFLFKENKEEIVETDLNFDSSLIDTVRTDLSQGQMFKNYILEKNILTKEQVRMVEANIEEQKKYGRNVYFIQTARRMKLLNEDDSAKVLSMVSKHEILSKNQIPMSRVYALNKRLLNVLRDFFIFEVNDNLKQITVIKDLVNENLNLNILEMYYIGYSITMLNVVDGVTREVIMDLTER